MFVMKTFVLVTLSAVLINDAASMTHSMMTFETSSTQVPNFPQFVFVGYVNGLPVGYYDSDTKRMVPKQEWMKRITEEDPQFWDRNTQIGLNMEQWYKANTETARQRLNLTEGLHLWQRMYGCEWDDETNEIHGYWQFAFDGEDFIAFDLKTETFVAPRPEAFITKQKWERNGFTVPRYKDYITHECVEELKKHLRNGQSALMRKELPEVYFLQKSPSSPVTCHATGFYPDRAMLFWTKDGEEVYEGVESWEILPNHDGTFQQSADLDLTSVPPEDWERYECVFQLSGVPDIFHKLERSKIMTNAEDHTSTSSITYVMVALGVAGLVILAGVALFVVKKKKAECPQISQMDLQAKERLNTHESASEQSNSSQSSANDAEVAETLNPGGER